MRPIMMVLACIAALASAPASHAADGPRPLPDTTEGIHVFSDQLPGGLSGDLLTFAATHYDAAQKMTRADADALHAVNPGFVILHYRLAGWLGDRAPDANCRPSGEAIQVIDGSWTPEWPGDAAVQESWFFHLGGQRVLNCGWGWWVMDLDDPGWRTYWTDQVLQQLAHNDDDGVFADSASVPNEFGGASFRPTLKDYDPPFEADWSARIARFLAYVKSRFAGRYYLIPNVGSFVTTRDRTDYSAADGIMVEGFGYDALAGFGADDWAQQMNRSLALIGQNKAFIGQSYRLDTVQQRLFTLASYLLIKGSATYLNEDASGISVQWMPEYDIPIGHPLSPPPANVAALLVPDSGVYRRDFSNGLVLVNTDSTDHAVQLGETLELAQPSGGGAVPDNAQLPAAWGLGYQSVTQVSLPAGSAAVLVRDI